MHLYVEGGGDKNKSLQIACRKGFRQFLEKAGLKGHMPRIVACGGRQQAYDDFCTALRQGKPAMLLVDSEDAVATQSPWGHLLQRAGDGWPQPPESTDDHCHLMVQCMESWFLADRDTLRTFFDQGYNEKALPSAERPIESLEKSSIYQALSAATRACKTKAPYNKGEHSFDLLSHVDPVKVAAASPWADRLVKSVKMAMGI